MKIYLKKYFMGVLIIVLVLGTILIITHILLVERLMFWRLIYPLQAQFSILSIHCNESAPPWMQESLKYIIKHQKNLSNQIAYIDANKELHTCQSGWESTTFFSKALTENTRFRYASLTKIVTSDANLQLVNQGEIQLTSKLIDFLPELKGQKFKDSRIQQITIANLLEHRAGFDRMRSEDTIFALNKKSWCPYDLSKLITLKLDFEPNKRYAYDNRNYCLLGMVLERAVEQNYRDYIKQKYELDTKNIKFVDKHYFLDEVKYDFRNNDFWMESDDNRFDFKALSSSAGLSGSAKQLAILMGDMLQNKPFNILSINQQTLTHCDIHQFKSCNGYAMWQYRASNNEPIMYFRNGGLPAVTSLAMVTQSKEVIVWIGNGASLYTKEFDENLLENFFYKQLNQH